MRILGRGKTRISGKSHSENQKVVILFVVIRITFSAVCLFCLLNNNLMLYDLYDKPRF